MIPVIERFLAKINVVDSGCWQWTARLSDGYGKININKTKVASHRFIYEYYYNRVIPQGMVIDHLCRNRACVNPEHLEVVTNQENIRRGLTGKINHRNSRKTHCPQGHEYTPENTYVKKNGWRSCKICDLEHARNQYVRIKNSL